jgi:molybdenum cofactor cytidylyltransferase
MGVAAIVLAAGASRRMGARNKLLIPGRDGVAMVARVVRSCLASGVCEVLVVVGHEAEAVRRAAGGVRFVEAPRHELGMAESLKAGVAAVSANAAVICLGDMPLVTSVVIDRLVGAWVPGAIVVPVYRGQRGNPVLWDRRYFEEIGALSGDRGARDLLLRHTAVVTEIDVGTDAVLTDFDTPESLSRRF